MGRFSGKIAGLILLLCLVAGCAASRQIGEQPTDSGGAGASDFQRALDTVYERERELADRLQQTEAEGQQLRVRVEALEVRLEELENKIVRLKGPAALQQLMGAPPQVKAAAPEVAKSEPVAQAAVTAPKEEQAPSAKVEQAPAPKEEAPPEDSDKAAPFDDLAVYKQALDHYYNRRFDEAMDLFSEILAQAPDSPRADNAQYWMGEYLFSSGRHRQALVEFGKVLSYAKTEKADDAQFMSARCYLAMGEVEKALEGFQIILDDYPESEYVDQATKEMNYLKGP